MFKVTLSVSKIFQNKQEWLSSVREDQDMRNATLDNRRNMKQMLIWCKFVPCILAIEKHKNSVNSS